MLYNHKQTQKHCSAIISVKNLMGGNLQIRKQLEETVFIPSLIQLIVKEATRLKFQRPAL